MKNTKKVAYYAVSTIETLFIVFVATLALLNGVMFFQQKVLNYPVPKLFGYSFVNILSGSMEPTFSAGDLVICKEQATYHENDPVLFEDQGFLVLHRIVEVNDDGSFVTKGDANNTNDKGDISPENVYGKMSHILPGWGTTLAYLSSRMGAFWTILASVFIYLALDTTKDLLKESTEEEKDNKSASTKGGKSFETVFNEVMQEKKAKRKGDA